MLILLPFKLLTSVKSGLNKMDYIFLMLLLRLLSLVISYVMLNMISTSRRLVSVLDTTNVLLVLVRTLLTTLFHGTSLGVVVFKVTGLGELVLPTLTVVTNPH
jgi:hypothetical protein